MTDEVDDYHEYENNMKTIKEEKKVLCHICSYNLELSKMADHIEQHEFISNPFKTNIFSRYDLK